MDRRAWRATVHRVAKSGTRLKRLNTHTGQSLGFLEGNPEAAACPGTLAGDSCLSWLPPIHLSPVAFRLEMLSQPRKLPLVMRAKEVPTAMAQTGKRWGTGKGRHWPSCQGLMLLVWKQTDWG